MPLTDPQIRRARPGPAPVKLADGGGLHLEVRTSGAKLWRYRYRIAGKENLYAIGTYFDDRRDGHVSLEDARAARDRARALARQGIHPAHLRRAERLAIQSANASGVEAMAKDLLDRVRRIERQGAQTVAMAARQRLTAVLRDTAYTQELLQRRRTPAAPQPALRGAALAGAVQRRMNAAKKQGKALALFDAVRAELQAAGGQSTEAGRLNAAYIEVRKLLAAWRAAP